MVEFSFKQDLCSIVCIHTSYIPSSVELTNTTLVIFGLSVGVQMAGKQRPILTGKVQ